VGAYDTYVTSLAPAGYWKLGEASGTTAADSSGHSRTGTYTVKAGAPGGSHVTYAQTSIIPSETATCVLFDGWEDVHIPGDSTLRTTGSFTIMGAAKGTNGTVGALFAMLNDNSVFSNHGWDIAGLVPPNTAAITGDMLATGYDSSPLSPGEYDWTHAHLIAMVYNQPAQSMVIYVDGIYAAGTPVPVYTPGGTSDLWLGGNDSYDQHGYMQGWAYWGSALSPAQIAAAAQAGGFLNGLVATVDGLPVSVLAGTLQAQQQIGQRGTGSAEVWSPLGVLWSYGTAVNIVDGSGNLAFTGYISKDKATKDTGSRQGTGYLHHYLTLMDNAYRADKRLVTRSYLQVTADAIVIDLATTILAAEGVSMTGSSVAAGILIPQVSWVLEQVSQALDWLAEQCGYWWMIDQAGVLWFQPYTGRPSGITLDGTTLSADDQLAVTQGNDQFVDSQYAKGGYAETGLRTETFAGDGSRRQFTLSYEVSSSISVYRNGAGQSLGTKAVDTGKQWYYAVGDQVIAQDDSIGSTLGSGDRLVVTYKGRYPMIANAQSPNLIAQQQIKEGGGTGLVEAVYADNKFYTQDALLQIATARLNKYGAELDQLDYQTVTNGGLQVGQQATVTLSDFALSNKSMLVTSMTVTDAPTQGGAQLWYQYILVGSPYDAVQPAAYYKRLMHQRPDPDLTVLGNIVTVFTLSGALQANSVLSVTAQVVAPAGADPLIANSVLQGP
jgi:hypothetical protein